MIPNVLKSFVNSEKAVAAGVLVVVVTIFVFTNKITVQEWMDYTKVLLGIYVAGKAVQGGASAFANGKKPDLDALADELTIRLLANDNEADKELDGKPE